MEGKEEWLVNITLEHDNREGYYGLVAFEG